MSHLEDVGETYTEHAAEAFRMALASLYAAGYFTMHGLMPSKFQSEGGDKILQLALQIKERRSNMRRRKWRDRH